MAKKFQSSETNFRAETMVEVGVLQLWINRIRILTNTGAVEYTLPSGNYVGQWEVNGQQGITRYSVRIFVNGQLIYSIGPKKLKNGNRDFDAFQFSIP